MALRMRQVPMTSNEITKEIVNSISGTGWSRKNDVKLSKLTGRIR